MQLCPTHAKHTTPRNKQINATDKQLQQTNKQTNNAKEVPRKKRDNVWRQQCHLVMDIYEDISAPWQSIYKWCNIPIVKNTKFAIQIFTWLCCPDHTKILHFCCCVSCVAWAVFICIYTVVMLLSDSCGVGLRENSQLFTAARICSRTLLCHFSVWDSHSFSDPCFLATGSSPKLYHDR